MSFPLHYPDEADRRFRADWRFYAAFVSSTAAHLVILGVCAGIYLTVVDVTPRPMIDAALKKPRVPKLEVKPLKQQLSSINVDQAQSKTSPSTQRFRAGGPIEATPIDQPLQSASLVPADGFDPGSGVDWGAQVDGISASAAAGDGNGGSGGVGFFKVKDDVKSVVFVVDCSTSMRKAHASQWKTRFRRLQAELVHSISRMKDDQKFFIIFFNDEAIPMPARALQPAVPRVKRHYLRWMARQRPNGQTDPRTAMGIALRLQPDAIYFLTDGVFGFKIRQQLMKIRQSRVAIHTFAFGNAKAEFSMKAIAAANGGKYVFVP